jgi:hypothetical protein
MVRATGLEHSQTSWSYLKHSFLDSLRDFFHDSFQSVVVPQVGPRLRLQSRR